MANDWNSQIIKEFRENHGKLGGNFTGAPLLLLGTTGAKSGEARTHPMMYLDDGDRLYVFASYAGRPENPAWYHNLKANPRVTVEVGPETYEAIATEVTGTERDEIFAEQVRRFAGFGEYQEKTDRTIPVIALTRV